MDGDIAPSRGICEVAERYGAAIMVDDAQASGVFGPGDWDSGRRRPVAQGQAWSGASLAYRV
jgi:hypothetical protein